MAAPADYVLVARGLRKSYPGVLAVQGVDLALTGGHVHALVGENGAGKSTLIRMITGAVVPDGGDVTVNGQLLRVTNPAGALRAGIAAVHQEPNVVPALTPVANVFLGQARTTGGFLRERTMTRRFLEWTDLLGVDVPTTGPAGALPVGTQQAIEIIRALEHDAAVMVMDEPTASLSLAERDGLFRIVELLRNRGTAVLFISHNLDDVLRVSNTVTVLRDGQRVVTTPADQATPETLVHAMLGAGLEEVLRDASRHHTETTNVTAPRHVTSARPGPVLVVEGLRVPGRLERVHLELAAGEILGVAGLVGSGRSTLLRALGGAEPTAEGRLRVHGREVRWPHSPRRAAELGIGLAPEDRRTQGLVMSLDAGANLVLPSLNRLSRLGFATRRRLDGTAATQAPAVGFDPTRMGARAGTLSGGNQQKLVLGKLLLTAPAVLLVDEPARGVDIGAKAEIFRLLLRLAGEGMAIVMVSEETDELLSLVDRLLVLRAGTVSAHFDAATADPDDVLTHMFPASAAPAA